MKKLSMKRKSFLGSINSDFASFNKMRLKIKPRSKRSSPKNDSNPFEGISRAEFKKYRP